MKHLQLLSGIAAASLSLLLSSCKEDPYTLMFLTQADGAEGGSAFVTMYNGKHYDRLPMLTLNQFASFSSFTNPDGSYGITLHASPEAQTRLFTTTAQNRGKLILPIAGGLAFEPQTITSAINDGKLIIWGGLNGYDLRRISEVTPPLKPELEIPRYLEENPRPLPTFKDAAKQKRDMQGRVIPEILQHQ